MRQLSQKRGQKSRTHYLPFTYRLISETPNWQQDSLDGKRYSVDPGNTYSLVGWYKVNDDGTLEPYNLSSPITDNITLRALWRVVGEYHVRYSVEGVDAQGNPLYVEDEEGNPTEMRLLGTNAPSDTTKNVTDESTANGAPLTVDGNVTVNFTNTRKIADIVIKKEDDVGHALPGAEFTLFSLETASPTVVSTLKIGETTHENGIISMGDVSEITVSNLASGNYRLVETHAPDGYVILTRGIDFSVDASNGAVTLIKESIETVEGETMTSYVPAEASDYPDASASDNVITVKNTPGAALPNTGGPGTNLIYLLGTILTALAGAGLVMRRRRKA